MFSEQARARARMATQLVHAKATEARQAVAARMAPDQLPLVRASYADHDDAHRATWREVRDFVWLGAVCTLAALGQFPVLGAWFLAYITGLEDGIVHLAKWVGGKVAGLFGDVRERRRREKVDQALDAINREHGVGSDGPAVQQPEAPQPSQPRAPALPDPQAGVPVLLDDVAVQRRYWEESLAAIAAQQTPRQMHEAAAAVIAGAPRRRGLADTTVGDYRRAAHLIARLRNRDAIRLVIRATLAAHGVQPAAPAPRRSRPAMALAQ